MSSPADLRADCSRCFALCCVASTFQRSADFAIDKPAGVACLHLADDHRCTIHDHLAPAGFPGCVAFDCFGAGQRLAQDTFGGRDWRVHPEVATPMMAAFPVMRGLHELLWYLHEAVAWACPDDVRRELRGVLDQVEATASSHPCGWPTPTSPPSRAGLRRCCAPRVPPYDVAWAAPTTPRPTSREPICAGRT